MKLKEKELDINVSSNEFKAFFEDAEKQFEIEKIKLVRDIQNEQNIENNPNKKIIGKSINILQQKLIQYENDLRKCKNLLKNSKKHDFKANGVEHNKLIGFHDEEDQVIKLLSERIEILKSEIESGSIDTGMAFIMAL